MSEELKPCLRCGHENPHVFINFGRDWVVKCVDGCAFSMDGYKTKTAAIRQWNFRPLEDRRLEQLERMYEDKKTDIEIKNDLHQQISELTAERDALKADIETLMLTDEQSDREIGRLNAENERMRAALEKIAQSGGRLTPLSEKMQNIARAALEEVKP